MPPIDELTRIEPVHLDRLLRQGIFTTGLLLEVSETAARRQTLADQVDASTNDTTITASSHSDATDSGSAGKVPLPVSEVSRVVR